MLRTTLLTATLAASCGLAAAASGLDSPAAPSQKALELANQVREASQRAITGSTEPGSRVARLAQESKRRVDSIANEALQADRNQVLRLLGIDPEAPGGLFYFLSFSMPLDLLRAYVSEAMWTGGTVVFRGIPRGRTMGQFVKEDLQSLVYGKGASANISIDPRLFDAYGVKAVPAIVYTTDRSNILCESNLKCAERNGDTFFKVSGAVTSDYALRTMISAGATGASAHLKALAKGYRSGQAPGKFIRPFQGDWKTVVTPEEVLLAKQRRAEAARRAQQKGR